MYMLIIAILYINNNKHEICTPSLKLVLDTKMCWGK